MAAKDKKKNKQDRVPRGHTNNLFRSNKTFTFDEYSNHIRHFASSPYIVSTDGSFKLLQANRESLSGKFASLDYTTYQKNTEILFKTFAKARRKKENEVLRPVLSALGLTEKNFLDRLNSKNIENQELVSIEQAVRNIVEKRVRVNNLDQKKISDIIYKRVLDKNPSATASNYDANEYEYDKYFKVLYRKIVDYFDGFSDLATLLTDPDVRDVLGLSAATGAGMNKLLDDILAIGSTSMIEANQTSLFKDFNPITSRSHKGSILGPASEVLGAIHLKDVAMSFNKSLEKETVNLDDAALASAVDFIEAAVVGTGAVGTVSDTRSIDLLLTINMKDQTLKYIPVDVKAGRSSKEFYYNMTRNYELGKIFLEMISKGATNTGDALLYKTILYNIYYYGDLFLTPKEATAVAGYIVKDPRFFKDFEAVGSQAHLGMPILLNHNNKFERFSDAMSQVGMALSFGNKKVELKYQKPSAPFSDARKVYRQKVKGYYNKINSYVFPATRKAIEDAAQAAEASLSAQKSPMKITLTVGPKSNGGIRT